MYIYVYIYIYERERESVFIHSRVHTSTQIIIINTTPSTATTTTTDEDLRVDEAQKDAISKKAIAAAKAQLQNLLDAPLPDARTFNAMQKKRARTENRGGRYTDTTNNSTTAGIGKPGKKGWKKNITPVVDNNWKRRSSFFVFAK